MRPALAASPFVIAAPPGFSPQVGRLASMLEYVRRTTVETAEGLSREQLDHLHDPESNSIGALLAHVAAIELAYQLATFDERGLRPAEEKRWRPALDLGALGRAHLRGRSLSDYLADLEEVRARTLRELQARDDAWLERTTPFWGGLPANNLFKWFHVLEDELNHRGQMRWLRRRLPRR